MKRKTILTILATLIVGYSVFQWQTNNDEQDIVLEDNIEQDSELVVVKLPERFSDSVIIGERIFEAKCASCHGQNAAGQKGVAPSLIHKIYEPSHHGDESFQRAVALGVRAHHWPFGDMPPVEGLTRAEVATIIAFVRELQRENGID